MQRYEIVLKNEKEKFYKIINWLLLAADFLFILLLAISDRFTKPVPFVLTVAALIAVVLMYYFKTMDKRFSFQVLFFIFFFAWVFAGFWLLAVFNLLFAILSFISLQKPVVVITEENISYPSLFNKRIAWSELSNMVLKDELLTIDFKNNKLIQQLIDNSKTNIDEKEFNDFCKSRLN